jgi:hypothetical protein
MKKMIEATTNNLFPIGYLLVGYLNSLKQKDNYSSNLTDEHPKINRKSNKICLFRYRNFGIYITFEGGKWRVESGIFYPPSTFYIPPSNLKEVIGHDYSPSP